MNKLVIALSICTFGVTAYAQSGKSAKPATATPPSGATAAAGAAPEKMEMPKPGPEQDALKPFVHNMTSTGTTVAGAMGPNSPEMKTKGKAMCKWIDGNLWAACDIEESAGTGKTAMKWMGHWVFGYDALAKGYRGVMVDNMGMMMPMKGTLDGAKMTWESATEMKVPNMPSKMRFTEDATDPKNIKFTEEGEMNGKWMERSTAVHKVR
jgi:hypothetical protein